MDSKPRLISKKKHTIIPKCVTKCDHMWQRINNCEPCSPTIYQCIKCGILRL